jgi:hypothetical protein
MVPPPDITEMRILNSMVANEIMIVLLYELKKARIQVQDKISRINERQSKLDIQYRSVETNGNGDLCMKLLAESEMLSHQRTELQELRKYYNTLG